MKILIAVIFTITAVIFLGCDSEQKSHSIESAKLERGQRILGMDVKVVPTVDYDTAYHQAIALGVREVSISLDWAELEPRVGQYDDTFPMIINGYYPLKTSDVSLILRPLDTAGPRLPKDLEGLGWDDPQVITAFDNFLTHLHAQVPQLNVSGQLKWLHVGNEIDAQLASDPLKWAQWKVFFIAAKSKIEALWGTEIEVSSIIQFSSLQHDAKRQLYLNLLPHLDSAALTYYPLDEQFMVKGASNVASDFQFMVNNIPDKNIILQECGYPSSQLNISSEIQQAKFISAVFTAWDQYQDRIPLIDFAWQYDVSEEQVDQWVIAYGMSQQPVQFKYYLWSLGLSNHDGTEKLAMAQLREQLSARHWSR